MPYVSFVGGIKMETPESPISNTVEDKPTMELILNYISGSRWERLRMENEMGSII